jgi:antitoxin Phd
MSPVEQVLLVNNVPKDTRIKWLASGHQNGYLGCVAIIDHSRRPSVDNQFTISEAKNNLPAIVHAVEKGPSVKLTRRGRPVAVLLSIKEYEALSRKRVGFYNSLKSFRDKNRNVAISDQDFENLRDSSPGREVDLT